VVSHTAAVLLNRGRLKRFRGAKNVSSSIRIKRELALGQRRLIAIFEGSSQHTQNSGETLQGNQIYHLRTGWACQFRDLSNGHRIIVDLYLPGDMIGLDTVLHTRPLEEVVALTAVTMGTVAGENGLLDLMAYRPTALYTAWLLGQRQRRADRLVAAISSLDAAGRLATMVLDVYTRLKRRRLITGLTYNLPLSQIQIARYLGLTVVHVNRVLRSMREAGIVSLERHCVTILDLGRLMTLAQNEALGTSSNPRNDGRPPISTAFPPTDGSLVTQLGTAGVDASAEASPSLG
jgi:CRP-like cAMP-binding protein